jgi:RNA polymerase sigma factor for flagellar operon FliA
VFPAGFPAWPHPCWVSEELLQQYAATRDPALRDHLAVRHLPLAKYVARKLSSSLPSHIEIDDLVSWGSLGLLDAIDKFDPELGHKFSTYAVIRIRGAILDGLQSMDWAPKQITARVRAVRRLREQLTNELGYEPSVAELAQRLDCSPAEVRSWLLDDAATRVTSLTPTHDDEEHGHDLADAGAPDQEIAGEVAELCSRVTVAVRGLGERERAVFLLYYRDNMTLRQIADTLGVSVSSATQTHTRLVEQVRDRLAMLGGVA